MSAISREVRSGGVASLGAAVVLAVSLAVTAGGAPSFAVTSQNSWPARVTDSNIATLGDSGLITEVEGAWYVDGDAVAEAAAELRITNSSQVGYDRDLFPHWSDLDGNGCDARNEILQRDLANVSLRAGDNCIVERGTLADPYTGEVIPFTRGVGTSGAVHIDHIVPLAAAWTGGANEWSSEQREAFANDPRNLQAVDGRANSAKGMRLASEWMPANTAFHCTYLAQLTNVLQTYDLAVTPLDQDAIINGGSIDGVAFAGATACVASSGAETVSTPIAPGPSAMSPQVTPTPEGASPAPPVETSAAGGENTAGAGTSGDAVLPWVLGAVGAVIVAVFVVRVRRRRA